MTKNYAVILGLDGMPLHAFPSLFEQGLMPYTKHLWQKLWSSELEIDLPYTLPSWTTISTGVNPGKHGIFDFMRPVSHGPPKLVTRNDVAHPTINEILAYNHEPSVTINVPLTYPPASRRKDCIVISDWTTPKLKAWPPEEEGTVKKLLTSQGPPTKPLTVEEYLERIVKGLEARLELLEHYYTRRTWRLFYTVIPEPDWIFHKAYAETVLEKRPPKPVVKAFHLIDKAIKMTYENMPENTLYLMCSDHGSTMATIAINGNVLLKKAGLLKTTEEKLDVRSMIALTAAKLLPPQLRHRVKYKAQVIAQTIGGIKGLDHATTPINYIESKAYMTVSYNLYVNPSLHPHEREKVLLSIIKLFSPLRNLFKTIARGENLFHGPKTRYAPDLVLIPKDGVNISTRLLSNKLVERGKWYVHSTTGFIALNVKPRSSRPRSLDIVPTVLSHLGIPLPNDCDGTPLLINAKISTRNYLGAYVVFRRAQKLRL